MTLDDPGPTQIRLARQSDLGPWLRVLDGRASRDYLCGAVIDDSMPRSSREISSLFRCPALPPLKISPEGRPLNAGPKESRSNSTEVTGRLLGQPPGRLSLPLCRLYASTSTHALPGAPSTRAAPRKCTLNVLLPRASPLPPRATLEDLGEEELSPCSSSLSALTGPARASTLRLSAATVSGAWL